jgi:ammonia channel protein AmtB
MIPSSVAFTALGAALLWFGWFGFTAGSELAADGVAASAFLIVVYVTKLVCGGLRVDGQDERTGLDSALHGERAFEIE